MRRGLVTMLALAGTAGAAWAGSSSTIVVGGSPAQRAAVREAVHALGGTIVERIELVALPDARTRLLFAPNTGPPDPTWVRAEWDETAVAVAYQRLARKRGLPEVSSFSTTLSPAQSVRPPRRLPAFRRAAIVPPVSRAIRASGARRIELNVFRPAGAVDVAAVVQTRDPAAFIDRRLDGIIRALNLITPRRLDSYYVAVVDETRTVVFAYSAAETQGMFTFYVRPDLYGCADDLPIQNEVAPDGAPPCPA